MKLKAIIIKRDRRILPYEVHRRHGTGIPEASTTCHWTLRAAERAAKHYTKTHEPDIEIITFVGDDGKLEPPPLPGKKIREP